MPCKFGGRQRFSFPHTFLDLGATPGRTYPPRKTPVAIGQGTGWASWPDLVSPKNHASTGVRTPDSPTSSEYYVIRNYYLVHSALNILSSMSLCGQLKFSPGVTTLLFLFAKSIIFMNGFSCHLVPHSEHLTNQNVCTEHCTHVTSGMYVGIVLT